jgi:outer membrane receptor protein involved in Fe transport
MIMSRRTALLACSSVVAVCLASAPPALAAEPNDTTQVEEIIVTAQKRAESINDIGMSIQAFSGETLEKAGVESAADLAQVVPGFNFARSSANTPIYTVRGIGFQTPNLSSTSPVGVYMDEVALAYPYMSNGPVYDLERVEVLKGPQGTLYGRNTTGGLVSFVTARPTSTPEARATVELGNYQTVNAEGYVSGPLAEGLSARLSARQESSGKGWQKSVSRDARLGDVNRLGARFSLLWEPDDRLTGRLTASYWRDRSDTVAAQAVQFNPDSPTFAVSGVDRSVRAHWKGDEADWTAGSPDRPAYEVNSEFYSVLGRLDYKLANGAQLTSLTGYNQVERRDFNDVDGTPFELSEYLSDGEVKSFSQEVRLSGDLSGVGYIVGAYYSNDDISDDQVGYYRDSSILNQLAAVGQLVPQTVYTPAQIANGFNRFRNTTEQESRSKSVFVHLRRQFTPTFRVEAGLRYTRDNLHFEGCSRDFENNTAPVWNTGVALVVALRRGQPVRNPGVGPNQCLTFRSDFSGANPINVRDLKQDNVAGRLNFDWTPRENLLVFGSVSRGYKSGAFPVVAANVETQLAPAVQEEVTAYELGVKAGLFDRRLQANLSTFFYDYKDKQLFGEIQDPVFVSLTRIVNVPKSEVYGGEAELIWQVSPALQARVGGSYTHTEVTRFVGFNRFGAVQDFAGAAFPYTPKYQMNVLLSYDAPITETLALQANIGASYQSKAEGAISGERAFEVDAYTVVNGSIGLRTLDGRTAISVFARNLFDEDYWTSTDILTDTTARIPGRPRTLGVSLTRSFN